MPNQATFADIEDIAPDHIQKNKNVWTENEISGKK
jgi:hypothetical protein